MTKDKSAKTGPITLRLPDELLERIAERQDKFKRETGVSPSISALFRTAIEFYLDHWDEIFAQKQTGYRKADILIEEEQFQKAKEVAAQQGLSFERFFAHLVEREVAGSSINLDSLDPDEAEIAQAVVRIYRNPDPQDLFEKSMVGFLQYIKNRKRPV